MARTVHVIFTPMHRMGVGGIPRRYYDYPEVFIVGNAVATAGTLGMRMLVIM